MERYLPVFCFCLGTANIVFALGALVFRHFRSGGLRTGRALMFLISGILFIVVCRNFVCAQVCFYDGKDSGNLLIVAF